MLIPIGGLDHGRKGFAELRGRIVLGQLVGALEECDQRVERGILVVGRTIAVDEAIAFAFETLMQRVDYARLADPGLAGEQNYLTLAVGGLLAAVDQQSDLLDDVRPAG